jgi:predicted SnoaL-like aldol condensation-catalyzing enzyme
MQKIVNNNDSGVVRNMNNIINLHEVMINQRQPEEAVAKFLDPGYIQHDHLLETGAAGLANFSNR